jgi:peptidoglycan/LPS O-acetylase OafA/YrhL
MGLMRFLLATAVVVNHITFMDPDAANIPLIPGTTAVEVFFSISGFYMSLILTGKYHDCRTFYVNRFLRLYPVYLTVTLATWAWFLFVWRYLGKQPTNDWIDAYQHMSWWQVALLVASNWTMVGQDIATSFFFNPDEGFSFFLFSHHAGPTHGARFLTIYPAWSIGLEIWFYLIAPFLVPLRSRWIVLIGVVSITLNSVMAKFGLQTYTFFPSQLFFFMAGMLLHRAYVAKSLENVDRRIAFGALIIVVALFLSFDRLPKPIHTEYVIYATLIPAIPLLFALTGKNRIDIALGNLSYPIYIVHVLIINVADNLLHHVNVKWNVEIAFIIIVAVVVTSMILYVVIEKPVDEIRQRLVKGVRPSLQSEALPAMNVASQI